MGWADYSTATFTQAFTFINGTMKNLGTLGGSASYALGINNNGLITGYSKTAGNTAIHAFIYSTANASISNTDDAGTLGGLNSYGNAINSLGVAVGSSLLAGNLQQHAASYYIGGHVDLGTLGGDNSYAYGVNDSMIVGAALTNNNNGLHAFSYDANGHFSDLGVLDPADVASQTNAINNKGQIVGWSQRTGGSHHAFLYSGGVMRDLNKMIAPGSGLTIAEANGINEAGQIVGRAVSNAAAFAVLLTPRTIQAPTVAISGKAKVRTKKTKVTITGSATGDVTSITYMIGKKTSQTATGTKAWTFQTAKLKHGKNVITVTGHGYGGTSAPVSIMVIRA